MNQTLDQSGKPVDGAGRNVLNAAISGPGRRFAFRRARAKLYAVNSTQERIFGIRGQTVTPRRIFVVDDNPDTANTLGKLLRLEGHEVVVFHDGHTAIQQALALKPDVVFLDIALPGLSGYDVARQIRAQPSGASVILIAVTGYGQPEDRSQAFDAGFNHHFTKPVRLADLTAAIPSRSRDPL